MKPYRYVYRISLKRSHGEPYTKGARNGRMNVVPIPVPRNGKSNEKKKNKHHPAQTAQGLQDVPQATEHEGTIG